MNELKEAKLWLRCVKLQEELKTYFICVMSYVYMDGQVRSSYDLWRNACFNEEGFRNLNLIELYFKLTMLVNEKRDKMSLRPLNPVWFEIAKNYIGEKEIKGSKHNAKIVEWFRKIKASWFKDDETPWCAAFVGGVLSECGLSSTNSAMARSYEKYGLQLSEPIVGSIVVFWRGQPSGKSGHVGFVAGRTKEGELVVLGGNQKDSVSLAKFDINRVLSYRWPESEIEPTLKGFDNLPLINLNSKVSNNEQ